MTVMMMILRQLQGSTKGRDNAGDDPNDRQTNNHISYFFLFSFMIYFLHFYFI